MRQKKYFFFENGNRCLKKINEETKNKNIFIERHKIIVLIFFTFSYNFHNKYFFNFFNLEDSNILFIHLLQVFKDSYKFL